jgi:hypothetical protein
LAISSKQLRHIGLVPRDVEEEDLPSGSERRLEIRHPATAHRWLDTVRLKYRANVKVIDVSSRGMQIETTGQPLQPGSTVVVEIVGQERSFAVPATVRRCHVSGVSPNIVYRGGLAFRRPIDLPAVTPTRTPDPVRPTERHPRPRLASSRSSGAAAAPPTRSAAGAWQTAAEPTMIETAQAIDAPVPAGWHRLVVRYADGRLLKGYGREFTASSGSVQVWPTPQSPVSERITVPLSYVKAVFFVRDFAGDPSYVECATEDALQRGRRVEVTFLDGETLVGTTLNYTENGVGFFIHPVDPRSNNARIFIASSAIRQVRSAR